MSTQARILMVEPTHFDVSYRINPWMKPDLWAKEPGRLAAAARRASEVLHQALVGAGCQVIVGAATPGLPDMVFPANAAIVLDGRALLARFRYPQRQGEEAAFLTLFEGLCERGLLTEVAQLPPGCYQEGAGDAIWDGNRQWFWAAYGPRSSEASLARIGEFFGREVVPMELVSDRCYHLDVCFCPLSGGEILYFAPALTAQALRTLRERVPSEMLIQATEEDLARFSVNAVNVGRNVIMATPTDRLRSVLAERGYMVTPVDLSPFMMSGGGAYCMTLRLDRTSAGETAGHAREPETALA
ncbi:MAG: arginine deiminase-related protein [Pigmentiphaga sp.]|uniref:dimethylarginine dimethylaminohydrolase family protein n=1 Tax=Pigmentiphaga sp. TaxID=1977564 RepID=UPI0029B4A6C7|nr:arginine deiminase-related protein [Pigmentiphaga sp.]MDX3905515.1 arginine deiminase-related protein [Pigmentiphaga sp.]